MPLASRYSVRILNQPITTLSTAAATTSPAALAAQPAGEPVASFQSSLSKAAGTVDGSSNARSPRTPEKKAATEPVLAAPELISSATLAPVVLPVAGLQSQQQHLKDTELPVVGASAEMANGTTTTFAANDAAPSLSRGSTTALLPPAGAVSAEGDGVVGALAPGMTPALEPTLAAVPTANLSPANSGLDQKLAGSAISKGGTIEASDASTSASVPAAGKGSITVQKSQVVVAAVSTWAALALAHAAPATPQVQQVEQVAPGANMGAAKVPAQPVQELTAAASGAVTAPGNMNPMLAETVNQNATTITAAPAQQSSVLVSGVPGKPVKADAVSSAGKTSVKSTKVATDQTSPKSGVTANGTAQSGAAQSGDKSAAPATANSNGNQAAPVVQSGPQTNQPQMAHDPAPIVQPMVAPAGTTMSTVPAAADSPQAGASSSAADGSVGASAAPAAAASAAADAPAPLPAINTARVLQTMQGSEMRVGMHTVEFGNVQISTSINTLATHQTMAAQLSFEHADLARMVTAHLPAIESKLSTDSGMQTRLEIRDQSAPAGGHSGSNAGGDQGTQRRSSGPSSGSASAFSEATHAPVSSDMAMPGTSVVSTRLDIHI